MSEHPSDWPGPGPIDLAVHDRPHASSSTEWWYVNAHLKTADDRNLAVFASFFRVIKGRDEVTRELEYAHSVTWALVDLDGERYYQESVVDKDAARMGLEKLERGEGGTSDPRLRRSMRETLERGKVPYPDRVFEGDVFVHDRRLELDFDGRRFRKLDDGSYRLELYHDVFHVGCELVFHPDKAPVRHGSDGVVKSVDGGDMFYYFVPRCSVTGAVTLNGSPVPLAEGRGWYDHEFGGHRQEGDDAIMDVAWNWAALQLADGREITAYTMEDLESGDFLGKRLLVIDADGTRHEHEDVELEPSGGWVSTRTFNSYPTRWRLQVPSAKIDLALEADFDDQEFVTLISKPAFWEGHVKARGTLGDAEVTGVGWAERSGYVDNDTLDDFFKSVSKQTRASVAALMPFDPTYEQVRDLVASEDRDHYMDGVDLEEFVRTGVKPVREITDRGGKAWRSYAALACCDVVGGDSRKFVQWLAMPELMHVGSLIVDDVQDKSTVRRGGPTCHMIYGEALAINAGTAAYFMGQKLLKGSHVSDSDKLRLYDLYFEAMRAGHAGQAADIEGLDKHAVRAVETGDPEPLERRVLAIHRLKTAAPAGALSRMGAIAGGGKEIQIEALGRYFETLGLAFQIVDDVLNLRGFKGDLKQRGEDISHGKVTLPVAKAMGRLDQPKRQQLWDIVKSKPQDPAVVASAIELMESCGAVQACEDEAREMIDRAWVELLPHIEESIQSLMLRAFGWYVLERHY